MTKILYCSFLLLLIFSFLSAGDPVGECSADNPECSIEHSTCHSEGDYRCYCVDNYHRFENEGGDISCKETFAGCTQDNSQCGDHQVCNFEAQRCRCADDSVLNEYYQCQLRCDANACSDNQVCNHETGFCKDRCSEGSCDNRICNQDTGFCRSCIQMANECPEGSECSADGTCTSGNTVECSEGDQCDNHKVCVDGQCKSCSTSGEPQCNDGLYCIEDGCYQCAENSDMYGCDEGLICVEGDCKTRCSPECPEGTTCSEENPESDTAYCRYEQGCGDGCLDGKECRDGECRPIEDGCANDGECENMNQCNDNGECYCPDVIEGWAVSSIGNCKWFQCKDEGDVCPDGFECHTLEEDGETYKICKEQQDVGPVKGCCRNSANERCLLLTQDECLENGDQYKRDGDCKEEDNCHIDGDGDRVYCCGADDRCSVTSRDICTTGWREHAEDCCILDEEEKGCCCTEEGPRDKTRAQCPEGRTFHSKTCNLFEDYSYPCCAPGLGGDGCNRPRCHINDVGDYSCGPHAECDNERVCRCKNTYDYDAADQRCVDPSDDHGPCDIYVYAILVFLGFDLDTFPLPVCRGIIEEFLAYLEEVGFEFTGDGESVEGVIIGIRACAKNFGQAQRAINVILHAVGVIGDEGLDETDRNASTGVRNSFEENGLIASGGEEVDSNAETGSSSTSAAPKFKSIFSYLF